MLAYECQKWGVDLELDVGLFVAEEKSSLVLVC